MLLLLLGWCPKIPIGTQRISNSTSPSAFLILWFNVIEITSAKFSGRAQIPPAVDGEILFDSNWSIARLIRVQLMLFKGHCKRSCRSYCRPWICGSGSESNSASRFQKNDIFFCRLRMFLWSSLILGRRTFCKARFLFVLHPRDHLARVITVLFVCAMEDWFSAPTPLSDSTPQKLSSGSKDAGCWCMQVWLS